jgi:hypothetical protein
MKGFVETTKESEYKVYRDLKWQEIMNPKDKFDNRLYVSMRYKHFDYNSEIDDEIFKTNFNRDTFRTVLVNIF